MSKDEVAQVFISTVTEEVMPTWAPPTPPQDENDLYCDYSLGFLYDREIMTESQLPPVYIPKESKRIRLENITNRKQAKIRKDENVNIPRSLFDKPSPFILKLRKEVKVQKLRGLINGGPDIGQLQRILNNFGPNYTLPQPTTLQQQAGWVALAALLLYIASFAIGLGPVFWLMISEIYPTGIRSKAMAAATVGNWAANFLVAVSFLSLGEAITRQGTFFLYTGLGVLAFLFFLSRVPETSNRSLEQIQEELTAEPAPR